MALYNGYSFNSNGESKSTIHWPCVKAYSKCRARLTTSLEGKLTRVTADHNHAPPRFIVFQFVRNHCGKELAIYDGYAFYHHQDSMTTKRWPCQKVSTKCRARLTTNKEGQLIHANTNHNHLPPRFVIRQVHWVKSVPGKQLALVNGYTFSFDGGSWRCTMRASKCKARFYLDSQFRINKSNFLHTHDAPKYLIKNGIYIKL
ncbi:FLYWCH zinc finger domain-containing protein [Phthorimaea operculella]|nr:FLYWCH zinc finger domain-containing protein [Phthorimaea operculella]